MNARTAKSPFSVGLVGICLTAWAGYTTPARAADPPGSWRTIAAMPQPITGARACVVDGIIYLTGGLTGNLIAPDNMAAYNPATDTWENRTRIPSDRWIHAACVVDGIIYVLGGEVPRNAADEFLAYDPRTDTWTTLAPMPNPRVYPSVSTVDGIIYVIGGGGDGWWGGPFDSVHAYDPRTNTWSNRGPMPAPVAYPSSTIVDGLIFVFDGDAVFIYDPRADAWTMGTSPLGTIWNHNPEAIGTSGGLVYVVHSSEVLVYDPMLNTARFETTPSVQRFDAASAVIEGRIYIFGGSTGWCGPSCGDLIVETNQVYTIKPSINVITQPPLQQTLAATSELTLSVTVDPASGPCTYQWQRDGVVIAGATSATFTLPCVQCFHAGDYSVVVSSEFGSTTSAAATVTIEPPPPSAARLLNVSTRALCRTGDQVLIPGFVIAGTENKQLLLRAVGPTLGLHPFDLVGVLPNPRLALKRWNGAGYDDVAANNDWRDNANVAAIAAATAQASAFPLIADRDAALLVDLAPGQYTVFADCADGGSGVAIVELYDADHSTASTDSPQAGSGQVTNDARLINLSNRGFAGVGDEVMIPGFVVSDEGAKTLLVRVVGPTLAGAPFGVANAMADPKLALHRHEDDGTNTLLFTQDNWSESADAAHTAAIAAQVQAFPLVSGSKDAAFVVTLPPGVYTVVGSSADGVSSGIVLVELYVVP